MENLTQRQRELAAFVAAGFSNQQIADFLHIRRQTVKNHVQAVYRKLHVRNRVELCLQLSGAKVAHIQRFLVEDRVAPKAEIRHSSPVRRVSVA
jgi:DNA-binding CsgD family transcriptional regulator